MTLEVLAVSSCALDRWGRIGTGLLEEQGDGPARLVVAELAGEGLLLGRHQRARSAVHLDRAPPVWRRLGGGRTVRAGDGVVGILLRVPAAGLSAPIAPDRAINRLVRGLRRGLVRAGAGDVFYFGRDFLSTAGRQVGVVSQDGTPDGVIVFEALLAMGRSLELPPDLAAYPPHSDPRAGGPPHGAIVECVGLAPPAPPVLAGPSWNWRGPTFAAGRSLRRSESASVSLGSRPGAPGRSGDREHASLGSPPADLADAIARGYAEVDGCEPVAFDGPPREGSTPDPAVAEDEAGWERSGVADVPIGFAEALVRIGGDRVEGVRLRGDFIAPTFTIRDLESALEGCPLTFEDLGHRVDAAFRRPGAAIHGVAGLRVLADAVLAAAGKV